MENLTFCCSTRIESAEVSHNQKRLDKISEMFHIIITDIFSIVSKVFPFKSIAC